MKKIGYICRQCGEKFTADILEPGEAEEKRIRPARVSCPLCGSKAVERR